MVIASKRQGGLASTGKSSFSGISEKQTGRCFLIKIKVELH